MDPWAEHRFEYPKNVPTMLSGEERRYLHWLSSSCWKGNGHIVEMGPWLGGSTIALAAGMSESGKVSNWRLHVYDSFVWRQFMADRHQLEIGVGESFQPFFEENLRDFADLLTVNRATLPDEPVEGDSFAHALRGEHQGVDEEVRWPSGEPVEILFVDGAKSWSGFRRLLSIFGPFLLPGESLLVLQDYKYWGDFWVAAITELLSSKLSLAHNLRDNTVTFELTSTLDADALAVVPSWSELTAERCEALLEDAARRLERAGDAEGGAIVRLGAVRMWMHKGEPARAFTCFRASERAWPLTARDGNLSAARDWLQAETGRSLPPTVKTLIRGRVHGLRRTARMLWKRTTTSGAHRGRTGPGQAEPR